MRSEVIYNSNQIEILANIINSIDYFDWNTLDEGGRYKLYPYDNDTPKWIQDIKNKVDQVMKIKNYFPEPTTYQCLLRFNPGIKFDFHIDTIYRGFSHKRYNIYFTEPEEDCFILHEDKKTKIISGVCYEVCADKVHGLTEVKGSTPLLGILFGYLFKSDV